jgi:hypothetical protein
MTEKAARLAARRAADRDPGKNPKKAPADWRAEICARVRSLIAQALPDAVEAVKWRKPSNGMRGVPVFERDGLLCTCETYKDKVKLTFAQGAALDDPAGLFNSGLAGGTRRAIDVFEGGRIDEDAFMALVRAAAKLNAARRAQRSGSSRAAPDRT